MYNFKKLILFSQIFTFQLSYCAQADNDEKFEDIEIGCLENQNNSIFQDPHKKVSDLNDDEIIDFISKLSDSNTHKLADPNIVTHVLKYFLVKDNILYSPALFKAVELIPRKITTLRNYYGPKAISNDDQFVISSFGGATAEFADVLTGKKHTINHNSDIVSAEISSDNKFIVTSSVNETKIKYLDTDEERIITHVGNIENAIISPNNKFVVIHLLDGTADIIDLMNCESNHYKKPINNNSNYKAVISNDGKIIAASPDDNTVGIYLSTGEVRIIKHSRKIDKLFISNNSQYVLTGSWDSTAKVINVLTGKQFIIEHDRPLEELKVSNDNQFVAAFSVDGIAKVLNLSTGEERKFKISNLTNQSRNIKLALISNDSKFLVTCSNRGTANIICLLTGEQRLINTQSTTSYDDHVDFIAISNDSQFVVVLYEKKFGNDFKDYRKVIKIINLHKNKELTIGCELYTESLVISDNSKFIVVTAEFTDGLFIIDLHTGEQCNIDGLYGDRHNVCISNNCQYISTKPKFRDCIDIIDLQLPDYIKKLNMLQIVLIYYLYNQAAANMVNKETYRNWDKRIYLNEKQRAVFNSLPENVKINLLKHYRFKYIKSNSASNRCCEIM